MLERDSDLNDPIFCALAHQKQLVSFFLFFDEQLEHDDHF